MQVFIEAQGAEARAALVRMLRGGGLAPYLPDPGEAPAGTRPVLIHEAEDTAAALQRLRQAGHGGPLVVAVTADDPDAVARYLDEGADDVVRLPVSGRELAARLRSIERRYAGHAAAAVEVGEVRAFLDGRDPEVMGEPVPLTRREQEILQALVRAGGRVVDKQALYETLYAYEDVPPLPKVVDVHVCTLRRKLAAAAPSGHSYIVTVHRRGYRFGLPRMTLREAVKKAETRPDS